MPGELFVIPASQVSLGERVRALVRDIQDLYQRHQRPFIVGYSGGKDSTVVTQLVWRAIAALPPEARRYPVHVIAGDTRVEDFAMASRIRLSVKRIDETAQERQLGISATVVEPLLQDRFFVKLIGKGYRAPRSHSRWCTERLKIGPASRFIEARASEVGEVIIVLGARRQESATRAQAMAAHVIPGSVLRRHATLPRALVYAPIEDWSTQDVWDYLLNVPSPWGDTNRELVALYRQCDGECPLVVDSSTPTCGGSRFGCWTCTVTDHNRSLETRYDAGEDWVKPMLAFRELLLETVDPRRSFEFREVRGRVDNKIFLTRKGEVAPRSYTMQTRKMLLRRLLEAQVQVQREGPDPSFELISREELAEIRRIWITEDGDWEDSLPAIYAEVTGVEVIWDGAVLPFGRHSAEVKRRLEDAARGRDLPVALLLRVIEAERRALDGDDEADALVQVRALLEKDWRPPEVAIAELQEARAAFLDQEIQGQPNQLELW